MQKLLRQGLVISGLAALGMAACAGVSYAGTANLNLTRTIAADCTFTSPNYSNSSGIVDVAGAFAESITWEGVVGISCNHGGSVQVTSSSPSVSPAVTSARSLPTYNGEYLNIGGTNIWKNGNYTADASVTLAPSLTIPYVAVLSTTPGASGPGLANGDYAYTFTLTATPN
ncbi:hypothetical protein [Anabaena sp. CCY 9910]|uniref:hypothetical protein n=1 Tax=Anabaena sp. CCY 9910 TaxID=3103870 RepID=UPI0039E08F81